MTNVLTKNIAGREMKVESGRVGMLSDAAIFMSYGDTVILTNVNASEKPREGIDFFPLSVEYEERLYSVGKIQVDSSREKVDLQKMQFFLEEL